MLLKNSYRISFKLNLNRAGDTIKIHIYFYDVSLPTKGSICLYFEAPKYTL
jgi:hypothetical protein